MNQNTKDSLQRFIAAIQVMAKLIEPMCGTGIVHVLEDAAEDLKSRLDRDETII